MVWSGYAVLMSGKTDSIKLNNNPGCLSGSTFVYIEVFKLDISSASWYETDIQEQDKNKATNDKTEYGMEKT
ncbi:hypothetical protein Tco_0421081, partial [Tanacetum coccineum]